MEDKDKDISWRYVRKIYLKGCTETLIWSAQEQSIPTNYNKCNFKKTVESLVCSCSV